MEPRHPLHSRTRKRRKKTAEKKAESYCFFPFENRTYTRNDRRLAFLPPLADFSVDLIPQLRLDLSRIAREQREEALGPRVDDINLVQGDRVGHFASLLELAIRARDEFRLREIECRNEPRGV